VLSKLEATVAVCVLLISTGVNIMDVTAAIVLSCSGVHNKTVEHIVHPPFVLPPLPTLRGILNRRVGDKLLEGDNRFEQELLLGSELIHQPNDDYLLLGSDVLYKKNVRKELPVRDVSPGQDTGVLWRRGMRRWTALPDVLEVSLN